MVLSKASSGLGHSKSECIDSITLVIVKAGLHWSFKISKHKEPYELILQW